MNDSHYFWGVLELCVTWLLYYGIILSLYLVQQ